MGLLLRSKLVFSLPFIHYNTLLEAHSRFTFQGWITLILYFLLKEELLAPRQAHGSFYTPLLASLAVFAWLTLLAYSSPVTAPLAQVTTGCYVLTTLAYTIRFLHDLRSSAATHHVKNLATCALLAQLISWPALALVNYPQGLPGSTILQVRNALFTYLHFQYNGFFMLSALAITLHRLDPRISPTLMKKARRLSWLLAGSLLPTLALTYLWQPVPLALSLVAGAGSLLLLAALAYLIPLLPPLLRMFRDQGSTTRSIAALALVSLVAKMILQALLCLPWVGSPVFGNRPVIMAYLHLVFLGCITLLLIALLIQIGLLDIQKKLTPVASWVFATGVVWNELVLFSQGIGSLLFAAGTLFYWLLWSAACWLTAGALLLLLSVILPSRPAVTVRHRSSA